MGRFNRKANNAFCLIVAVLWVWVSSASAQIEVNDAEMESRGRELEVPSTATVDASPEPGGSSPSAKPTHGREAARDYFKKRDQQRSAAKPSGATAGRAPASGASSEHFMALHLGLFLNDDSYAWGKTHQTSVGQFNLGVTYRVGEWSNSMDFLFRAEFQAYKLMEGRANKLSVVPLIVFPDSKSQFPIYFGAGIGPGVFFKQLKREASLSLDYQVIVGARFFELVDNMGFMIETGVKNHLLLTSDGQFNSIFVAIGWVFEF